MSKKLSRRDFLKAAAAGTASIAAAGLLGACTSSSSSDEESASTSTTGIYTPGTYTATAQGMGTVTVTMTFDATSITDVQVDVSEETETIGGKIGDSMAESLLAAQGTDIDSVSGATVTSTAIRTAAADCIAQAKGVEFTGLNTGETVSWRTPMDLAASIEEEYSADVIVVGAGHAGIAAAREAAESGKSVILLESQSEDVYSAMGNAAGVINSEYLLNKGCPEIDPVEFYNNWQLNTNNGANPTLVMKFAQNGGAAADWFITDLCTEEEMASTSTQYFPRNEERRQNMVNEIGPHKFWSSSIDCYGSLTMTQVHQYNMDKIVENGGEVVYGMKGQYLVQNDNGDVTGIVCKKDGKFYQYNGSAVVLATGGFGSNQEMMQDLLKDLVYEMTEDDTLASMGMDRDGSGIAMAYWAGAKIEEGRTIATMDGRTPWIGGAPGLSLSIGHPQGIWLDESGKRFENEYWGPIEFRNRPVLTMNRDRFYGVYDSNLPTYLEYVACNHGTKDPTEAFLANVQSAMNAAVEAGAEGYQVQDPNSFWYGAETLEEVVSFLDCSDKVKQNIIDSVERWNGYCEAGADQEFGRDPAVMFPVKEGPFFIQVTDHDSSIGNLMCTMGGLVTNGEQQVLGDRWKPMKGLFATGNCSGGRFGDDYFTPLFGVSIGICIGLGRECGKSVVKYLNGDLDY